MPRVVPDQKSKFDNEEFFRKLSRECEVGWSGSEGRATEWRSRDKQQNTRSFYKVASRVCLNNPIKTMQHSFLKNKYLPSLHSSISSKKKSYVALVFLEVQ